MFEDSYQVLIWISAKRPIRMNWTPMIKRRILMKSIGETQRPSKKILLTITKTPAIAPRKRNIMPKPPNI